MAIKAWWESDPDETFWMEITDRADLGANLHAPQSDGSGRDYWSYSLVTHVNEGDVVFHWWKPPGDEPGIVGYSRAVGALQTSRINWQAHGSVGRARGTASTTPSWLQPLGDFVELDQKFSQTDLRRHEDGLRLLRGELEAEHGNPLYFPFEVGDKRPPRAFQGYLVKFPRSLVREFGLPHADIPLVEPQSGEVTASAPVAVVVPAGGARRQADPQVRRAIEKHAVRAVEQALRSEAWETADVGDFRAYDIHATKDGEELHVEVKGSATTGVYTIDLTSGEIAHAASHRTLLAVVEGITWTRAGDEIQTTGGAMRLWWDWQPEEERLVATDYRYALPEGD